MIPITWPNLVPPEFTYQDIVSFFLTPAIFENEELGEAIQRSPHYRKRKGSIKSSLETSKSACTRLFQCNPNDSLNDSEKIMLLLLEQTEKENIPYNMNTYPIRHAFKVCWKLFFKEKYKDAPDLLNDYKHYINLFLKENETIKGFEEKAKLDLLKRVKKEKRDFQEVSVSIPYKKNPDEDSPITIKLDDLLNAIQKADYSASPYLDEQHTVDISDEDNLFFERMATLSVIASVWYIFMAVADEKNTAKQKKKDQYTQQIEDLSKMIFPEDKVHELFSDKSDNDISVQDTKTPTKFQENETARRMLIPVPGYMNAKDFSSAGEICEQVFLQFHGSASAEVLAEALDYLYTCCANGYRVPSSFVSKEDIQKRAQYYGNFQENETARRMLIPVPGYMNAKDFSSAGEICEQVFLQFHGSASAEVLAEALGYLYTCCANGYRVPSGFVSIEDIQKRAQYYGNIYNGRKRKHIKADVNISKISTYGYLTVNCENSVSEWIEKSKPALWETEELKELESTLHPNSHQRVVLVNDDFDINLQDALNVLDYIKKSISDKKETKLSDWKDFELYIRCNEEECAPLLDTALSYFAEDSQIQASDPSAFIKVYFIDEAKRSADYLFARHPLFYPLTTLPQKMLKEDTKSAKLHVVILSDNPNQHYAKWLIKEAFWLLPCLREGIATKISLISPQASEICDSILSDCPGLACFSYDSIHQKVSMASRESEKIKIADIPSHEIHYKDTSFSDRTILNTLWDTYASNDYLYFIVDSASDIESIRLATRVRELSIRKSVMEGHINSYSKRNFIIAVHCNDPDYAGLTRDLIIPKEPTDADQWFNTYHFIPFGSMDQLYSWDELNGGTIEEISQCVHLQYCQSSCEKDRCKENLKSYFERLYNRNSSFSVALSMPYRLFKAGISPTDWTSWDIQDPDAWWKKEIRMQMAKKYNKKLSKEPTCQTKDASLNTPQIDEEFRQNLAIYEQVRWCCYQLTCGWLPVHPTDVIQYMRSGVSRHVLQIAKLHPCICSWDDLKQLHSSLSNEATRKIISSKKIDIDTLSKEELKPLLDRKFAKYYSYDQDYSYFQTLNYENIERTADILTNKWHTDELFLSSDEIDR